MTIHSLEEKEWSYDELYKGCLLASIAHAIFVANAPELAYEMSWDGSNYSMNDSQGSRGTITFHEDGFVAGFRNEEYADDHTDAADYFKHAGPQVLELAEREALQYLLDEVDGRTVPSITAALWGNRFKTFASHPFEEMMERGGNLLWIQSMSPDEAFEACEEEYDFQDEQLSLLKKLYYLKAANPEQIIELTREDIIAIGAEDEEGISESRTSFAEIGIEWSEAIR